MDVKLVMFKANGQRKDFPIVKPSSVIGRAETCDLRIPLLSVSRRHCQMSISDDAVKVKDLASSNGTYVNNQRVSETELHAGDRLVIGPVVFTIQIDGQPEEIQQVKTRGQILAEQSDAGEGGIVDIEADIAAELAGPDLDETDMDLAAEDQDDQADQAGQDTDAMSALEALASQNDENEEDKQ